MSRSRVVYVLWAPQSGPICAYANPSLAWDHARTMLGVDVTSVEIRSELPEIVRHDMKSDYEDDDTTPVSLDDIEDAGDTE